MEEREYLDLSIHETKNYISAISGYTELIYRGIVSGDKAQEMWKKVYRTAKYLGDYTDKRYLYDLLHSRNYALHKQPVLLKQEIENTKNEVVAKWQQEIIIPDIVLEGKEEIQVSADKFLLEKLLFSVIENVVKYCSGNRIVFVKWSEEEDGIHFSIKNQAEIPEEESLKYFTEPYYRVDKMESRKMGGQGLGLANVSEIVKIHGWTMNLSYQNDWFVVELILDENAG
ncbi:MAG: HAMP domain-containing sensor histidine kinase [Lachnospiraceae bacterium]|nr:HAMP domain-containing sensor histidine kinase [Lachnospiraceae bacterium]